MSALSPAKRERSARSNLGVAVRRGDPAQIATARRDHAAARLAQLIPSTLARGIVLNADQVEALTALLRADHGDNR